VSGHWADGGKLIARQLDVGDAGIRERLEAGVVLGSRVAQGHKVR
jgi:hypothetical protein